MHMFDYCTIQFPEAKVEHRSKDSRLGYCSLSFQPAPLLFLNKMQSPPEVVLPKIHSKP